MTIKPKILLVEDDPTVTETMRDIFRYMKLIDCLQIASNGKVALQMMRRDKFDLVILDMLLPVMTGIELLRIADADPDMHGLRILVNSAKEPRLLREEISGFKNLCIDMLPRPFDPMEFIRKVQALAQGTSTEKREQ